MANEGAVLDALRDILAASTKDAAGAAKLGAKVAKKLGEPFAPLAPVFKGKFPREVIVQECLELADDHPLHRAADALIAERVIDWTPWTSIARERQPERPTSFVVLSRLRPIVYAVEWDSRVAVWSLENGAHLEDIPLPGKKATVLAMVELDDGTLRATIIDSAKAQRRTSVCECAPGARAFVEVHDLGKLSSAGATSTTDLRFHATQAASASRSPDEPNRIAIHDVVARAVREVELRAPALVNGWSWDGPNVVIAGERADPQRLAVFVINRDTMNVETIEVECAGSPFAAKLIRPGILFIDTFEGALELDLQAHTTKQVERSAAPPAVVRSEARGHVFDPARGELSVKGGITLRYKTAQPRGAVWDEPRGQLVIWGVDPEMPVTVIAPYDPRGAKSVPAAVETPAPNWARSGARLKLRVADFDAEDDYDVGVLRVGDAMELALSMDDTVLGPAMRVTPATIEQATRFSSLSQGSVTSPVGTDVANVLPPFLLSRAVAAQLAAGRAARWETGSGRAEEVRGGEVSRRSLRIDGSEGSVPVRTARGTSVSLTWLDDPQWPLILERSEASDCFMRVVEIDLRGARGERATPSQGLAAAGPPA